MQSRHQFVLHWLHRLRLCIHHLTHFSVQVEEHSAFKATAAKGNPLGNRVHDINLNTNYNDLMDGTYRALLYRWDINDIVINDTVDGCEIPRQLVTIR
jgi:hypothetical protein